LIRFDAAPPVPAGYPLLRALSPAELELARAAAYVADAVDPREPVSRVGLNNYDAPPAEDDLRDWRTRMYVIWFCWIYENFFIIGKPACAVEELILEFKAPDVIDLPAERLGALWAGACGWEPVPSAECERLLGSLKPHYLKAIGLLYQWNAGSAQSATS
jgi:hypothetical protein